MILDLDLGTALGLLFGLIAAFWGLIKVMMSQFEKRQDERFKVLTDTLTMQKDELDEHMKRQDGVMNELRRVEVNGNNELRRVEAALSAAQLNNHLVFQTKTESHTQHGELLAAIRAIATRIDEVVARPRNGTQ